MYTPDINKKLLAIKVAEIVNRLPPIPNNVGRILNLASQTSDNGTKILSMVKQDPGLSADLLHIANESSDKSQTIETIDDAFRDLGIRPVVQIVRFCYAQNTIRQYFNSLKYLQQYFIHSQNISKACRVLAKISGIAPHDRELYATAGLIHDIGRLVIFLASDRFNAPLIGTTVKKMASIDHDEKRVLGLSHSEVGWQLCKRWSFSPALQEAILRHHTPLKKTDFSIPGAFVFLAHFVSYSDISGDILSKMLPAELLAKLNLTTKDFIKARKMVKLKP